MREENCTNENSGRILPEFLRDKPGERVYGRESLPGQTFGHSTGLYSWKGDKP